MISPSDSMGFDLQPVSFNPTNDRGFGALIYVPVILVCCVIFSSLALGLTWLNLDVEYDYVDRPERDWYVEMEDRLSEREYIVDVGDGRERITQNNNDVEDEGYEDTVSQKVTLKVITIIMIVFTGIAMLLSLAAFTNYFPVVKIVTIIVWIIAVLSIAQIVIFAVFYNPAAGTAEDEEDVFIECDEDSLEETGFLNIYGEEKADCVLMGDNVEAKGVYYAGAAFWFAAVQMILIIIAAIMSTIYARNLASQGFPKVHFFQTY